MLLSAVPNPQYMNGTVAISGLPAGVNALIDLKKEYYANMNGTLGIDNSKQGRFALNTAVSQYGVGNTLPSKLLPTYTGAVADGMGAYLPRYEGEVADGMGTTGSLGVSMVAPYTRGGFPGELFNSAPMPTGRWKDAPTPVMLGTGEARPLTALEKVVGVAAIGFALWHLFGMSEDGKQSAYSARR